MSTRTCDRCVHATDGPAQWIMNKILCWPSMLNCSNCEQAPGRLVLTFTNATCRNFYPRRTPAVWTDPPKPERAELRHIALTKGYYATVDAADFERLNKHKWTALVTGSKVYAIRSEKGKTILMHREILNAPPHKVVDHIDGTGLNNSQANLRLCTKQQNLYNSKPRASRSKYKGVRYEKRTKKWIAEVTHKGKKHYLGSFDNEIAAAQAYDRKAAELFGPYARLNFPHEAPLAVPTDP
jgi:AP2 domain/HNH endonuclease